MSDELTGLSRNARRDWVLSALDEYEGPLLRYARRLTGELDLARDVVQHAFLRLCDQEPLRLDGRLAAWLYTVCRNRAIDLKRRDGRLEPLARHAGDVLHSAVATLPEKQQDAVNLWAEGFWYREISQITGDREGYVRVLVHRGVVALREHPALRRLAEEEEGRKQKAVSSRQESGDSSQESEGSGERGALAPR